MISSSQNSKIKLVRLLMGRPKERREANAFVVEGVRLVEEAAINNWGFQFALYDKSLSQRGKLQVEAMRSRGVDVEEISTSVMKTISETETPQGFVAVLNFNQLPIPEFANFILIPDQIRDPGNLGTLLRTAAATRVQAVLIPPETTDVFAPKVLRSGLGANFRLPIHVMDWAEIEKLTKGLQVYIAEMNGQSCWETDLRQPLALIIGSEAEGASESARRVSSAKIAIPMTGSMESLNAGVAGGVFMFVVGCATCIFYGFGV